MNLEKKVAYLPEIISCFLPKLVSYSLKFAGIIHIIESFMKGVIGNNISDDTIKSAIKLTEFYTGQVLQLVRLYSLEDDGFGERQKRIIQVLYKLQHKVVGGELPLSEIVKHYNESLNSNLMLTHEKMRSILNNGLGLDTEKTGANLSHLVWEEEKIQKLFRTTVTTVTSVTKNKDIEENK